MGSFLRGIFLGSLAVVAVVLALVLVVPPPPAPVAEATAGDEQVTLTAEAEPALRSDEEVLAEIRALMESAAAITPVVPEGFEEVTPEERARREAEARRLASLPPPLEDAGVLDLEGPALAANAARFEAPEEARLIAIVIDGAAGEALPPDVLVALPLPATVAIRPGAEGDQALAEAARARNWEVVARIASDGGVGALSAEMTPEEVEERTEAALARLGGALAATGEIGGDIGLPLRAALYETLARHGHGWLALDPAAEGAGLAQVGVAGRSADGADVRAVLDAAARSAQEAGAAVAVIPATREALEAAVTWRLGGGPQGAEIAPLSAVIRRAGAG